jgi:hypothetical protein
MLYGHEEKSQPAENKLSAIAKRTPILAHLSKNCTPIIEQMPMYKKTPKSTDIGICLSSGAAKILRPIMSDTKKPERRCSLISAILGESPGA